LNVFETDDGQEIVTINKGYIRDGEWKSTPFFNADRGDVNLISVSFSTLVSFSSFSNFSMVSNKSFGARKYRMLFSMPLFRSIFITSFYAHISADIRYNVHLWHNLFIKVLVRKEMQRYGCHWLIW